MAQATIMGHLGRDVESKMLPSGKQLHSFSVAVSEKRGQDKTTSWFHVNVWGELIGWKLKELRKGAPVLVFGRMHIETWEKDGQKSSKTVITADPFNGVNVFGKKDEDGGIVSQPRSSSAQFMDDDDSIPF
jgi:single-strand DNA-binding protein